MRLSPKVKGTVWLGIGAIAGGGYPGYPRPAPGGTIHQKTRGDLVPTLQIDRLWIETTGGPLGKPTGARKIELDGVYLNVFRTAAQQWRDRESGVEGKGVD